VRAAFLVQRGRYGASAVGHRDGCDGRRKARRLASVGRSLVRFEPVRSPI
jgi:hypothetical protein